MAKKAKRDENYFLGKKSGWGWHRLSDGSYSPAPCIMDKWRKIRERQAGIEAILKAVSDHFAGDLGRLATARQAFWLELYGDLGLDPEQFDLAVIGDDRVRVTQKPERDGQPAPHAGRGQARDGHDERHEP